MKIFFQFLASIWHHVVKGKGMSKRAQQDTHTDAIGFPHLSQKDMLEDYEMAAYHSQA